MRFAWAQSATSKEQKQEARRRFEEGKKAFRLGDFDAAIEEWKAGFRIQPDAVFLYNIALAYREKQELHKAVFFYRSYLKEAPKADNRAEVEERIAEMEALISARHSSVAAPAEANSSTETQDTQPATHDPPTARLAADALPSSKSFAESDQPGVAPAESLVADGSRREPPRGRGMRRAGMATAAMGAAILATGAWLLARTSSIEADIASARDRNESWDNIKPLVSDGNRDERMGLFAAGTGAAALIGGGIMYFLGRSQAEAPEGNVVVIPSADESTLGLTLAVGF